MASTVQARVSDGTQENPPLSDRSGSLLTLSALAAIWIATRPYYGIIDDARFYMVEGLRALRPGPYANDLYFQFGSQGEFTLFPKIYTLLVPLFGISATGLAVTIAGQLFWFLGLQYLARSLLKPRWQRTLAITGAIALPNIYLTGGFGYGEPFVTPRIFAEALTMLAIGLILRGHAKSALATLLVSATLHPLATLPGLGFVFIYFAARQRIWWMALLVGAIVLFALSITNIPPFANLRVVYDPQWFDVVKVRDWLALVAQWPTEAYFRTVGTVALACLALILAEPHERLFLGCAMAVGLSGIVCTLLGGDLAHDVLITEIQTWRSMWLLTLAANLYGLPGLIRLLHWDGEFTLSKAAFLIALGLRFLSFFIPPVIFASAPMTIIVICIVILQIRMGRRFEFVIRPVWQTAMFVVCGGAVLIIYAFTASGLASLWSDPFKQWPGMYSLVLVVLALAILTVERGGERPLHQMLGRSLRWLAPALFLLAIFGWNARAPWTGFVESSDSVPEALAEFVPANASVYWDGGIELLWFRLRRASYYSCTQGGGAMFQRGTAMEFRHRTESLWALRTSDFGGLLLCPNLDTTKKPEQPSDDLEDLKEACRKEPELDYLVLTRLIKGVQTKVWISPVPMPVFSPLARANAVAETNEFYRYSCASLRP